MSRFLNQFGLSVFIALSVAACAPENAAYKFSDAIQSLLDQKKYQEAIWEAHREGAPAEEISKLKSDLKHLAETEHFEVVTPTKKGDDAEGISDKVFLKYASGMEFIFKYDGGTKVVSVAEARVNKNKKAIYAADANSEVAFFLIDQLYDFNIAPFTFLKVVNGKSGSAQYMVKGTETGGVGQNSRNFVEMEVADFIAGNSDRHTMNWLYRQPYNAIVAIDHGFSFRSFDGGCIAGPYLFAIFASRNFRGCYTELEMEAFGRRTGRTMQQVYEYVRDQQYPTDGLVEVQLSKLNQNSKTKILSTDDAKIREVLGPHVQGKYLDKVLARIHQLQAILK